MYWDRHVKQLLADSHHSPYFVLHLIRAYNAIVESATRERNNATTYAHACEEPTMIQFGLSGILTWSTGNSVRQATF